MQGGQGTVSSVMEAAANVAASAKSGLDKTKAVVEAKAEKLSTRDEVEKDMASLRKEEKIDLAELRKCKAYAQNAVAAAGLAAPRFTDGGEFSTIGSFNQPAAAAATPNPVGQNAVGAHTHCWIPPGNFVVEDVAGSHCPVVRPGTAQAGSSDKVSETNTTGNANVGGTEVVDTNPTHTGMPAPVVEPDGVASGFNTESNTGSGTHFAMN